MPKAPPERGAALPRIYTLRKTKVVLDADLAAPYGVATFRLNEAVKRTASRFPEDFRFQLTNEEVENLISQNAISSGTHSGLRKRPWVFTEHGALRAANVLRSEMAVEMSLYLVQMREALLANTTILKRLAEIDRRLVEHASVLREVVERLQPLLDAPAVGDAKKPKIGFHRGNR
jgi:hypothetical protein